MNTTIAAIMLTAVVTSTLWLWILRAFIRTAAALNERKERIIAEMHADLMCARGLNRLRDIQRQPEQSEDPADWWRNF